MTLPNQGQPPASGLSVAGAWILHPGEEVPAELGADFDSACAALEVEPRGEGFALRYVYGTRLGGDTIRQLTAVTTLVQPTEAVMSLWADDVIAELPRIAKPQQLVNIVEGWRGPMIPDPVFVARGPAHERPEANLTHPPPDTTDGQHNPYRSRLPPDRRYRY